MQTATYLLQSKNQIYINLQYLLLYSVTVQITDSLRLKEIQIVMAVNVTRSLLGVEILSATLNSPKHTTEL